MKTPDEIKRGLECCLIADNDMCLCDECPYSRDGYNTLKCDIELGNDTIDYLIQHENAKDEWEMVAASPGAVEDMARENAQMAERIRQMERENEALKKVAFGQCRACKHYLATTSEEPCRRCRHVWACRGYESLWEWRGVEEDTK